MYLAGIWQDWADRETGEIFRTLSIVTTEANDIMSHIHSNPKNPRRMPVILPEAMLQKWRQPFDALGPYEKELIFELTRSYDGDDLLYYTTPKLIGKAGVGNTLIIPPKIGQ